MAAGRCLTVFLALAVTAADVTAQSPPVPAGNSTIAVTTGYDVTTEASHCASAGADSDDGASELASTLKSFKVMFDMTLALISSTIQVKGFGLAVINTLVNIGRFLVELHAARSRPPGAPPPLSYAHSTYF